MMPDSAIARAGSRSTGTGARSAAAAGAQDGAGRRLARLGRREPPRGCGCGGSRPAATRPSTGRRGGPDASTIATPARGIEDAISTGGGQQVPDGLEDAVADDGRRRRGSPTAGPSTRTQSCPGCRRRPESVSYTARPSSHLSDSLVITHPFHPLKGWRLPVLYTLRMRRGLFFVCEVEERRRITVQQDWTDRGVPASSERLGIEGLAAARAVVDSVDPHRTFDGGGEAATASGTDGDGRGRTSTRPGRRARPSPGGDGGGEHGRVAAAPGRER